MKSGEAVFVDSGTWIALALTRDPFHLRVVEAWQGMAELRPKLYTSAPVALETFTFLDRNAARDVALGWKEALKVVDGLTVLACTAEDIELAWKYFEHRDLHKLSAVDTTSFLLSNKGAIKQVLVSSEPGPKGRRCAQPRGIPRFFD